MGGQDNNKKADQQLSETSNNTRNQTEQNNKGKSSFDKRVEILKTIAMLLIPLVVAIFGYWTTHILENLRITETSKRVYIELMSQREQADSALRKDMFNFIIQSFFKAEDKSSLDKDQELECKVLELELLAYNFHESFNLKPLFNHLKRKIEARQENITLGKKAIPPYTPTPSGKVTDSSVPAETQNKTERHAPCFPGNNYLDRLKNVASEIIDKQMLVLEEVGQYKDSEINLVLSKEAGAQLKKEINLELAKPFDAERKQMDNQEKALIKDPKISEFDLTLNDTTRNFLIVVKKADLQNQELFVRLEISPPLNNKDGFKESARPIGSSDEGKTGSKEKNLVVTEFWLGAFDFPFIDNVRLPGDQRCSLVLKNFDYSKIEDGPDSDMRLSAKFTTVFFPGSYASLKEKPFIQEVVQNLIRTKKELAKE